MMAQRFQYAVVRYVPNVVRDEGINVGVLVREVHGDGFNYRFLPRSATVRKLWPPADTRLVANFERQVGLAARTGEGIGLVGHPSSRDFFEKARSEFNGN